MTQYTEQANAKRKKKYRKKSEQELKAFEEMKLDESSSSEEDEKKEEDPFGSDSDTFSDIEPWKAGPVRLQSSRTRKHKCRKISKSVDNYFDILLANKIKSAVGPPNLGRAQAPYSVLSFCLLGKK